MSRIVLDLNLNGFDELPGSLQVPARTATTEAKLWVHAHTDDTALLAHSGRPIVYTAPSSQSLQTTRSSIEQAVRAHREVAGSSAELRVDPNRYAGKRRTYAAAEVDPGFISLQDDLGLSSLTTDSGYIVNGDFAGMEALLNYGAEQNHRFKGRVTTDLPVDYQMVGTAPDKVRDLIEQYQTPVALKLAHPTDPFNAERNIAGLIHILDASTPVDLERTDIAGIGGLALGARRVSIGTTTSLRHVFPPSDSKGGGAGRFIDFAMLVPQALVFRGFARVLEAVALQPDDPRWVCLCVRCGGRSIESIRNPQSAWEHSLNLLFDLGDSILRLDSKEERMRTWSSQCGFADFVNDDIRDGLANWPVSTNLRNWKRALDAALSR